MICCVCDEDEPIFTKCVRCDKIFCNICVEIEKRLKTPLLNKNSVLHFL